MDPSAPTPDYGGASQIPTATKVDPATYSNEQPPQPPQPPLQQPQFSSSVPQPQPGYAYPTQPSYPPQVPFVVIANQQQQPQQPVVVQQYTRTQPTSEQTTQKICSLCLCFACPLLSWPFCCYFWFCNEDDMEVVTTERIIINPQQQQLRNQERMQNNMGGSPYR